MTILTIVMMLINLILLVYLLYKTRNTAILEKMEILQLNTIAKIQEFNENYQQKTESKMMDEFARNRNGFSLSVQSLREELHRSINQFSDAILKRMIEISQLQNTHFENIRKTVDDQLKSVRDENQKKLEEMRITVDEKLHSTLEKRLGEAFKQVGDRLEKVHQGLGDMQKLATGVGDLKNVLSNVKTRGFLGEIQLERELEQLLTRQQYEKNVKTKKNSSTFVEFAIKLPGSDPAEPPIWLPIDAKFPLEPYELLLTAYDSGNKIEIDRLTKRLATDIKTFAKDIHDKYIEPPATTDFALMYLPVEGLYAEILRIPGLFETMQKQYHIVPVGPTTLAAILNSLQMGFRTLAIEKRTSEVWKLLGAVKTQFGKFGDLLDKTQKKLNDAGKSIEDASRKSRYIEGRLNQVQILPEVESTELLNENESLPLNEEDTTES